MAAGAQDERRAGGRDPVVCVCGGQVQDVHAHPCEDRAAGGDLAPLDRPELAVVEALVEATLAWRSALVTDVTPLVVASVAARLPPA